MAVARVATLTSGVRLHRRPSASTLVGLALLAAIALAAAFAPLLSRWGATEIDFDASLVGPGSPRHPLGTDENGMDLLSRIFYAARVDLGVSLAAVAVAVLVGGTIGAVLGYLGGWLDEVTMRVVDVFQSFPAFVLALAVVAVLGNDLLNLVEVLALVSAPGYVRLMRTEVRSAREHGWVEAARAAGLSWPSILFGQVIPNTLRPVLVIAPLNCGWAILTLAGLSFLGLGVQVPEAEWGAMIATGANQLVSGEWWTSVIPGLALLVTVLAFNLTSEGALATTGPGH